MRISFLKWFVLLVAAAGLAALVQAEEARSTGYEPPSKQTSGALQASNLLNPNISAIGWFQAEAGRRRPGPGDADQRDESFQMKEAELAFQSVVDPWTRADFFVSVTPEEVDLEEGYLTFFRLPAALGLKIGKFKTNFGRFNRTHTPETSFADRPLVQQNFFGDEGLNGPGASLSWQIPNPWLFLNLDAEVVSAPSAEENPSFTKAHSKDVLTVGRLSGYYDLSESWNVSVGGEGAYGPAGQSFDPLLGSSDTLHTQLYGADVTFRWKNIRRSIYRSFVWTTEVLWSKHDTDASSVKAHGLFSAMDYQFAQRWHSGVRYDFSQFPTDGSTHEQGGLVYTTYSPSEFSSISLQGRHVQRADGESENLGFLKFTFNIGPHGAHPF